MEESTNSLQLLETPIQTSQVPAPPLRVVILTALQLEYQAVRTHLADLQEETHSSGTVYERGKFIRGDGRVVEVGIVEIGAGNTGTAFEAERAIRHFDPKAILFVGIAGGLKDVRIGDVVVATKVYGYHSGKAKRQFEARPDVRNTTYRMEQRARAEAKKDNWLKRIGIPELEVVPLVRVAPIAAGEKVIASTRSSVVRFLKQHYGDAVAVEMEGRGFLEATHANQHVEALIVRGVSDLIEDKQATDRLGSQEVAARNAAAFAFEIVSKLDLTQKHAEPEPTHSAIAVAGNQPPAEVQPRTVVVDAMGGGDFTNINDAISSGTAERISVRPGLYKGPIVLERPLELVGEGLPGEIVLQSRDVPALTFRANIGRVHNIACRQLGKASPACIAIDQGRLELEGCDVSGEGQCAILIRGASDPFLRWNIVHDTEGAGIVITDSARGIMESNKITNTRQAGIEMLNGASPVVRKNKVYDGLSAGIFVHDGGLGSIEANEVFGNSSGIYIRGANPTVRGNVIHDNLDVGVEIKQAASVVVSGNRIVGNSAEIRLSKAKATIRRNRIGKSGHGIIATNQCPLVLIEDNEIFEIGYSAVYVSDKSRAVVRKNQIHECNFVGVRIDEKSECSIEDNRINGGTTGIMIGEGDVEVRRNRITGCSQHAISAEKGSSGFIEDNSFSESVFKADGAQVHILRNRQLKKSN